MSDFTSLISQSAMPLRAGSLAGAGPDAGNVTVSGRQPAQDWQTHDPAAADPLRQAARSFESVLLSQMLSLSGAGIDDAISDSFGSAMWQSLLNDAFADAIADSGGFGIADIVYHELQQKTGQ